jgi:dolichol-phosphate mannosyltransferase
MQSPPPDTRRDEIDRICAGPTPCLSIVVPMYNEEENAPRLVESIRSVIAPLGMEWELVLVNDGSVDRTLEVIRQLALGHPFIKVVSYTPNRGRGAALRRGFAASRGRIVISTDADLSYEPALMIEMIRILQEEPDVDLVLASAYMPGGGVEGVPFTRYLVSRWGNRFLRATLPKRIHTVTCVFRAYRREVLTSMELESDGKELHLEIISKALAVGRRIKEIPAVLRNRKQGKSKHRFARTSFTHILFSFMEKPMLFFGLLGFALFLFGVCLGAYLLALYFQGQLNPVRPLMNLTALLVISGLFMVSFGFLAIKISLIRREIYKVQKENLEIRSEILARLERMNSELGNGNGRH